MLDGFLTIEDFASLRIFNPRRHYTSFPPSNLLENLYLISPAGVGLKAKFELLESSTCKIRAPPLGQWAQAYPYDVPLH